MIPITEGVDAVWAGELKLQVPPGGLSIHSSAIGGILMVTVDNVAKEYQDCYAPVLENTHSKCRFIFTLLFDIVEAPWPETKFAWLEQFTSVNQLQ